MVYYPRPRKASSFSEEAKTWRSTVKGKITEVLLARGPLTEEAIVYFLSHDHDLDVPAYDIPELIKFDDDFKMWYKELHNNRNPNRDVYVDHCVRLPDHELDEVTIPPHSENYVAAYHELHFLLEEARKDPSVLNIPASYLNIFNKNADERNLERLKGMAEAWKDA